MILSLTACGGNGGTAETQAPAANNTNTEAAADASNETVALTLWGAEEDQALLAQLVEEFKAAYPDQTFDIQIGVESESTAKDTVLTDIEAAADVFAFANDQLNDLVSAGALLNLSGDVSAVLPAYTGKTLDDVLAANGEGSVSAATKDGNVYAFPMGGGNNYFLYYDSTKITADQAKSWDELLSAAEAAGGKVGMTFASGWYNASFFLGAGFISDMNPDGTTVIDWNGTSSDGYTGVDVVKAMAAIAAHPGFLAIADGDISNQIASGAAHPGQDRKLPRLAVCRDRRHAYPAGRGAVRQARRCLQGRRQGADRHGGLQDRRAACYPGTHGRPDCCTYCRTDRRTGAYSRPGSGKHCRPRSNGSADRDPRAEGR